MIERVPMLEALAQLRRTIRLVACWRPEDGGILRADVKEL